jgi:HD-GYP domain-containing protein (c-di-GMP phosphodiesterase class II)
VGETDLQVEVNGQTVHINMRINTVWDLKDRSMGRINVARDITRQKELEQALRVLNADLEARVQARTQELADAYDSTLEGWARALELRDKETEGHSRRAVDLTLKLARALEVPEENLPHIWRGALHDDIGKVGIPKEILEKPGPLNNDEWVVMKQHPLIGEDLLSNIPFLVKAMEIVTYHHVRWDGGGYPHGLVGEQIPLTARIFTLVDYWDALRSNRPYRAAWSEAEALHYLIENNGTIFDPRMVEAFLNCCL